MAWPRYAGLFLLALVGCFEQNDALTPPLVQNADLLERDVFAVVINDVSPHSETTIELLPAGRVHVVPRTYGNRLVAAFGIPEDSLSPADSEAEKDFERRNADSGWAGVPLRLNIAYRWITKKEFRRKYFQPVVSVSRVGFSHDYRAAFVYVGYDCGGWCGNGNYVLLQRDAANVWRITHKHLAWIA